MDIVADTEFFADPVAAAKAAMDIDGKDDDNDNCNEVVDHANDNDDETEDDDEVVVTSTSTSKHIKTVHDDDVSIVEKQLNTVMDENSTIQQDNSNNNNNDAVVPTGSESTTTRTIINGKGIWNSWTRNFSSPLLALLDLLDNAFDAASLIHPGRIFILPDLCKDPLAAGNGTNTNTGTSTGVGSGKPKTTGLTLWNNSISPVKPLAKVLEVYTSLKGANANSIGENGVGLKQGCATLSNLSFCLVKNNGNQYSLGIIAFQLQTDSGCALPSFTFDSTNLTDLKEEMIQLFSADCNRNVGDCIARYGSLKGTMPDSTDRTRCLEYGIYRLHDKFQYISKQNGWDKYPHVFGLVVDHLKHGEKATNNAKNQSSNNDIMLSQSAMMTSKTSTDSTVDQQPFRVNKILETLYQDLPKRYLHIPQSLDVRVGGQVVNFNYWQPRLVEMAQFDLKINRTANIIDVFTMRKPHVTASNYFSIHGRNSQDDVLDVDNGMSDLIPSNGTAGSNKTVVIPPNDDYTLRIYTGFDALRVCDDRAPKTASMYMYSRHSGRLIKANMDCRGELGLTSGGTDYCQGLTVIIDDFNANFPLNPTKQDVAFGEQSNGDTHKRNLYIWLNAATRLYYCFYKDRVYDKQKRFLTEALKLIEPKVRQLILQSATSFQSLSDCQFTTFGDFTSHYLMNNGQSIRLLPFKSVEYFLGKDSRLQLPQVSENELDDTKGKPGPKPKGRITASRATAESIRSYNLETDDILDDDFQISQSREVAVNDDDQDDELYGSKQHLRRKQIISSKGVSKSRPDTNVIISRNGPTPAKVQKSGRKSATVSSLSKKRVRSTSLEKVAHTENVNYENDLSFMTSRINKLENENKHLKKDMKRAQNEHIAELVKKEQHIESLKSSEKELRRDLIAMTKQNKMVRQQVKDLIRSGSSNSIISQLDDMSGSRLSSGDAGKNAKRMKNLKSNLDVLKSENDDLKEHIKSLEETIVRKDKTIQAQRKLIDQRTLEDDEESDIQNEDSNDDDDDVDNMNNGNGGVNDYINNGINHRGEHTPLRDHISINSGTEDDASI